jgi:hypothetical protein
MENRWLLTLLLAPLLSPAALAVEAYSLYWYMLEEDSLSATAGQAQHGRIGESGPVEHGRLE